jgi:PH and SEC7 domain-containing protein
MRGQGPPTAYPSGLQPIASDDFSGRQNRRISRTDLDFEQALKAEGTVVLREGVDVNSLGMDMSPANSKGWSSPTTNTPVARAISRVALQPSTPIVIPPTPSPGPSTRLTTTNTVSSAVGSLLQSPSPHNDEPEDPERQTNRRSLYRSPGTSSSPDLATLLRKAKERGGPAVVSGAGHHKKHESPTPPLPDAQQSGSSNSYLSSTLVASPLSKSRSGAENHSTERTVGGARQPKENGTLKVSRFYISMLFGVHRLIVYLATQAISESKD